MSTAVITRSSTPSYLPHTRISLPCSANRRASAWSSRAPLGLVSTTVAPGIRPRAASMAANSGSGFITIPAPPPYGASSVTRCLPSAYSRTSVTRASRRPLSRALPRMLSAR